MDKDSLKIGDFVTLRDPTFNIFLGVEGILNEDVFGMEEISNIHDAIFCVHLQRQYSASRELHSFLQRHGNDPRSITDENEINYLKALERGRDNENSLNDTYMRKKMGQVVLFGDVIQLFHVKSGKYLQILPSKLARDERDNYKISLNVNGDAFSWIQICPRFKIDKDGDRIISSAEVYLKVAARNNEYVHSALRDPIPGHGREINCSLELTSWKLSIYQSSSDTMQKSLLLISQPVYINDPETKSYLSIERTAEDSLESENEGKKNDNDNVSDEMESTVEITDEVVLVPTTGEILDSNFLWMLEGASFFVGGAIKWKTEQVRLRHFNSGKYLILDNQIEVDEDGNETDSLIMQCVDDRAAGDTLFNMVEVNSTFKYLRNGKAMQLSNGGKWITRGDVRPGSTLSFDLTGTKEKDHALNLMITHYNPHQNKGKAVLKEEEEAGDYPDNGEEAESETIKEPFDVFVGLSIRNFLQKYLDMTVVDGENALNTIWPSAGRSDVEFFKGVIEKIVLFVRGFSVSTSQIQEGIDKADSKIQSFRQNLIRQQRTLELLIRFINKLLPLLESVEMGRTNRNLDNSLLLKMAQMVQSKCFAIMYYVIIENPKNQMFVADYMPIFLRSLNSQDLAVKCVTEMLSKNRELQETKIGTREIQIFVDKLKASKGNTMYLKLLQACCSCEGEGVDGNQCKVAKLLFEDTTDIFITVDVDYTNCQPGDWEVGSGNDLYLPQSFQDEDIIYGLDLIKKGLPKLTLSWVSSGNMRESKLGSVEDIFDPIFAPVVKDSLLSSTRSMSDMRSSSKGDSEQYKRRLVQDYFLAELFLGAELCMDRNYLAMHQLDKYFSYDILVAMMKMNVSNRLKAGTIRLLMCLHVDRDPQAGTKIPCLTRTWTETKKHTEPQLPFVDPLRKYQFGFIQQMISEHLYEMAGGHWDDLSRHMLKMLLTLVRFNFYGTNERMKDVIIPLIAVLDRRQVMFADSKSNMSKSMKSITIGSVGNPSIDKGPSVKFGRTSSRISSIAEESDNIKNEEVVDREVNEDGEEDYDPAASMSLLGRRKKRGFTSSYYASNRSSLRIYLEQLESDLMNIFILIIVMLAIGLDIYQVTTNSTYTAFNTLWIIEIVFLGIFALEMCARLYLFFRTQSSSYAILLDPINIIDFGAIVANILIFFLTPMVNEGMTFIKCLRLVRIARFYSTVRSAQITIGGDTDEDLEDIENVVFRYSRAPILELETMVEAVEVLAFMQKLIDDRNLSLFLRYFYLWESNADRRSPAQLFKQVVEDSKSLTLSVDKFEDIMLDCVMFVHPPLVQKVLEVLMSHYSMNSMILNNARDVQLLASSKREKQFRQVEKMLQTLEQNAETHELWGELESEEDKKTNDTTAKILANLIELCRVRCFVLEFDTDFVPDKEIQDLYRNLGCFEICLKVLGLLESIEPDENDELSDVALNTRSLCCQCNNLLYWFFLDNAKNQGLGFEELELFLKTLDDEINSHLVIQSIFRNNEALMRAVPHSHLSDLANRIANDSKSHHYLALFGAIAYVEEKTVIDGKVEIEQKNIVENQLEIVKTLTSPGRLQQVSCFFVPISHPDYELKRELMQPYLEREDSLSLDDLPPLLAYHLMFMEVLSGCTVGRSNITTVEAKVQSVFGYVDILESILDAGTIIACKIRLSKFFYNSIIETDLRIAGLEQSAAIWRLLQTYPAVLGYAKDEVRKVEKLGWDSPQVSRQRIEYIIICIMIAGGFFNCYYDPLTFRFSDASSSSAGSGDKVHISQSQVNELIGSLFMKIKELYDLDSPRLSSQVKDALFESLQVLNSKASKVIVSNLQPNDVVLHAVKDVVSVEGKLLEKYNAFVEEIEQDKKVAADLKHQKLEFIELLESLPRASDKVVADIRFESLIKKLVQHISGSITRSESKKFLDASTTKTSTWIIKSFRDMIENKMNMTIFERDEDGGLEEDEAAAPVINALCQCGVVSLVLDLIADGLDSQLQLEAIYLGIALLFKEGGALRVQTLMYEHLSKTNSESFFQDVRVIIQKLKAWHDWRKVIILKDGEEPKPPEEIWIIRFLQLMCEGHFQPNQDILREQRNNAYSYNLLDDFVVYLNCLSRIPCRTSTVVSIRVAATILEVIQGPCENNQAHFTLNTELIETLNRVNRAKLIHDCVLEEEIELKKISIDIFQGLLEGQGEKSAIYERVLSVIHLDIVQMMSKGMNSMSSDCKTDEPSEACEDEVALRTESVILLQMLCNYKPSLYDELGISRNIEDIVGSGTAMIEIVWRGDIHRRFFHIPDVCEFLAKTSKDNLVENVDRENAENKLIDFLKRSHDLYREVKHQEYLTELGISGIFSRENQNRATWLTFTFAIVINLLFLAYYIYKGQDPEVVKQEPLQVINAFNAIQLAIAAFVLIQNLVVRSPVTYQGYEADGHGLVYAVLYTACDPMTMYFALYLVLSFFGLFLADYYLPFLLLDIVAKDATTRDVLNAVVLPRKQLIMTIVLAVFVNYIYSYFYFHLFRDNIGGIWGDGVFPGENDCKTLWGCFKFMMCYSLRQGGGVGDVMNLNIDNQWIADSTYHLIVSIMLLNIVFGIIIDTFSSLRAAKLERLADTTEVCFICGIDKQVFDRASPDPDGFQTHITVDHNMWNYLYYIFMLWEQDRDDDDGLEQFVRRSIDRDEIIWFPLHKAKRLDQAATEEEQTVSILQRRIDDYEHAMTRKLQAFQSEMHVILDHITNATKQSYDSGDVKNGIARYLQEHAIQELVLDDPVETTAEILPPLSATGTTMAPFGDWGDVGDGVDPTGTSTWDDNSVGDDLSLHSMGSIDQYGSAGVSGGVEEVQLRLPVRVIHANNHSRSLQSSDASDNGDIRGTEGGIEGSGRPGSLTPGRQSRSPLLTRISELVTTSQDEGDHHELVSGLNILKHDRIVEDSSNRFLSEEEAEAIQLDNGEILDGMPRIIDDSSWRLEGQTYESFTEEEVQPIEKPVDESLAREEIDRKEDTGSSVAVSLSPVELEQEIVTDSNTDAASASASTSTSAASSMTAEHVEDVAATILNVPADDSDAQATSESEADTRPLVHSETVPVLFPHAPEDSSLSGENQSPDDSRTLLASQSEPLLPPRSIELQDSPVSSVNSVNSDNVAETKREDIEINDTEELPSAEMFFSANFPRSASSRSQRGPLNLPMTISEDDDYSTPSTRRSKSPVNKGSDGTS